MPQCIVCKAFLPSDFTIIISKPDEPEAQKCHFCTIGKDFLSVEGTVYTKSFVVEDYQAFMRGVADSGDVKQKIKDMIVDAAVKKHG